MKLILVRHGETRWNKEGRVQGNSSDTELSDRGIKQVSKLALFLKNENIAAVVSSPLKRTVAMAEAIASQHELSVVVDDEIRELDFGELEGVSFSKSSMSFGQFLMQWCQKGVSKRLPGGESLVELQKRCWITVERLLAEHKSETAVIVSHYFVIIAVLLKALDLPLECFTKFKLSPGSITILEFKDWGTRLVVFNDTSY